MVVKPKRRRLKGGRFLEEGYQHLKKKNDEREIRSSVAEYLSYVATVGNQQDNVEVRYEDENIWFTQKMMAKLYGVEVNTISEHIKKIYDDKELEEGATIRKFRIVQTEGSRQVTREVKHYSLQMIIAVGYKVDNQRAVQFRKWINKILKSYTIQGWALDSKRLENGGTMFTTEYFERLLERIERIRLSKRTIYQKLTDIYCMAFDYDRTAKTTQQFFAKVANKMRNSVEEDTEKEITYNSMITTYLEWAEDRAEHHIPLSMEDWAKNLELFLTADESDDFKEAFEVAKIIVKARGESEFEKYRIVQVDQHMSDYDKYLRELEQSLKK